MPIVGPVIRPPSEADSFLLQVTTGCSANHCTFCGAYVGKPFSVKPQEEIFTDIEEEREANPHTRRVFLLDGDSLAVSNAKLLPVLEKLSRAFPRLSRVASYANADNITRRSQAELRELRERKLTLIYLGLESGCQAILDRCRKRASVAEMVEAVRKADAEGIKSSVIVLLGLGGRDLSKTHALETADALNRMQPRYLSFLSLMLIPGTPLWEEAERGKFRELGPSELLMEARDIIAGLELDGTIFRSNHASNYLPLEGRFPRDKERLLSILDDALSGRVRLRPESMRGL